MRMSTPSEPNTASNAAGELRVPVADQEPERPDPLPQVLQQVTSLLRRPRPGRVRGDTQDVHPPAADLHHEQHIQPAQGDGLDAEEVGGQQPRSLGTQERPPAQAAAAGRRPDPGSGQDPADGAGADPVAKPEQFALDPPMPPQRVLPSQPEHQLAASSSIGGRPGRLGYVHRLRISRRCQASRVAGVTIRCARSSPCRRW